VEYQPIVLIFSKDFDPHDFVNEAFGEPFFGLFGERLSWHAKVSRLGPLVKTT
jgi:hypothetical protein